MPWINSKLACGSEPQRARNHCRCRSVSDRGFVGEFASFQAPSSLQWLHEIKCDGHWIQIHINADRRKVYTRDGPDWTRR